MPASYERGKGERISLNKWTATALLARYISIRKIIPPLLLPPPEVINEQALYKLEPDLNKVFRANSTGKRSGNRSRLPPPISGMPRPRVISFYPPLHIRVLPFIV